MASQPNPLLGPATGAIWPANNPVGTETLRGMETADPGFQPGVQWGGQTVSRPMYDMAQGAIGNALGWAGGTNFGAFHGSPYKFERFDNSAIGTGEGAQVYGMGHYLGGVERVSENYLGKDANWSYGRQKAQAIYDRLYDPALERGLDNAGWDKLNAQRNFWEQVVLGKAPRGVIDDMLANPGEYGANDLAYARSLDPNKFKRQGGHMYEVNVKADPEHFLDWDKPLSEQSQHVRDALQKAGITDEARRYFEANARMFPNPTGGNLHDYLRAAGYNPTRTSEMLRDAGIPGIRYLDQGSRAAGQGTRNTVVFDPEIIEILRRYGIAGLLGGGAAAAVAAPSQANANPLLRPR